MMRLKDRTEQNLNAITTLYELLSNVLKPTSIQNVGSTLDLNHDTPFKKHCSGSISGKMVLTSKTGLMEGVRKPVKRQQTMNYVEFPNIAHPAPYTLRPFAGVYNPFPYGCSILCNHPADYEAKEIVKRVKDSWATEGKALLLPEEVTAIRSGFLPAKYDNGEDDVPEELFRRYTDTDSRPLTPAPTLESVMTKGSFRRCVTPDPIPTHILNPTRERTLLVLDLRRSHSQDTLSWCGLSFPTTTTMQPLTKNTSLVQTGQNFHLPIKKKNNVKKKGAFSAKTAENDRCTNNKLQQQINTLSVSTDTLDVLADMTGGSGEEEPPKRRGKHRHHRKKSGKDGFRGPEKEFQGLPEPGETQVSALCSDSQNTSVQPSLTSGEMDVDLEVPISELCRSSQGGSSFIDAATLKQLQRELDQEVIDSEFNPKRHRALKEALKSRPEKKPTSEEMKQLKCETRLPPSSIEHFLTVPRNFSRQSSRFELPLDSRLLNTMTPTQYIQSYISISSGRRQLYNRIFNRHKESMEDSKTDRQMLGQNVVAALGEVMGRPLSNEQCKYMQDLIGWEDSDLLGFRTWGGICALCERLLACQFITSLPSRLTDPCHEVEEADFETLPRRLQGLHPDPRLVTILHSIWKL